MSRARFATAVSQSAEAPERASVREALWFDVEADATSDHDTLKGSRVSSFDHAALLLAATHLLIGITASPAIRSSLPSPPSRTRSSRLA